MKKIIFNITAASRCLRFYGTITILLSICLILIISAASYPDPAQILTELDYEFSEDFTKNTFTIPNEFDLVYNNYNDMQKEAGYDLFPYRGKECEMYTYEIYNHPFGNARANIIVYRGEVIGGDISSVELSGFMTPLI